MKRCQSPILVLSFLYPIAHFRAQYAGEHEGRVKIPLSPPRAWRASGATISRRPGHIRPPCLPPIGALGHYGSEILDNQQAVAYI
jgi:hypothetical protein